MPARILDGKALAKTIRENVADQVASFHRETSRSPGLAVLLVGEHPASKVYVRNKEKACKDVGIVGEVVRISAEATESELLDRIDVLNADPDVHGILVQLPLPAHIHERKVQQRVDPLKDVDGFHPENAGLLTLGTPRFIPCTPLGVRALLEHEGIETRGARAVILGRSNIVGKPLASLLLNKGSRGDATVTVCHTATKDAESIAREADILIAAIGRPEHVRRSWIKEGAVVIDVGIHSRSDGSLCGDVAFDEALEVASFLTPVPGGVGPLTVAMLLKNTLQAARANL